MNEPDQRRDSLPSAVWDRREECIDAFEVEWRAGRRPEMQTYLDRVPVSE